MDKDDEFRRQASMEADPDCAAAFTRRWRPLRAHLSPLIGENGFAALIGRAVRLAMPHVDCLGFEPAPKTSEHWFAALEQRLSTIDPAAAQAADTALMDAFTRQLTGLIGAALTERLLAAAAEGGDGQDKHRSTSK